MKKRSLLWMIVLMLTMVLAACSGSDKDNQAQNTDSDETETNETNESAYEPESIDPDVDVCEVCEMSIADDEHATQIVLENDRVLKYDDIGDMFVWMEENGEDEIGAKFVRDFNTQEWIQLEDATFVYDEDINTPMGFGVISFENSDDAEQYIEDHGLGELLTAADLDDHEWEMNMDDHGDHDHGDENHDGDHNEGHDDNDHDGNNHEKDHEENHNENDD